jgi:VCBS repeat-containing protein
MALEQRFMFDGAALVEAHAVLDTAPTDTPLLNDTPTSGPTSLLVTEPGAPAALTQALASAQTQVSAFLQAPGAADLLGQIFNHPSPTPDGNWQAAVDSLVGSGRLVDGPVTVELLSHAELQGAYGAFAAADGGHPATIYLNRDWLAAGPDANAVARVLIEEMGHAIDRALNGATDTQGDEGEAFAVAVLHLNVSDADRARIATEDDTRTLVLDGRNVTVETAAITFSAVYQGTPSALSEEAQSLNNIQVLPGSGFTFTSSNPADLYFSGNNVTGTLSYTDGNGAQQSIYGVASRLFKTGNTVDGIYFYAPGADGMIGTGDAGESAYLMRVNDVFTVGSDNGTSSDPVDTALNNLLVAYQAPTAYADTSASPGAQAAIEQGLATPGQNATGNVLTNDTGSATPSVTAVGTGSAGTPVTAGSTGADLSGGIAVVGEHGTLYIAADGTYRYEVDNSDPQVDALLDSADTLTDQFTYELTDAQGNTATARLTVTIRGANDAPVASDDVNSAKESLRTDATAYDATDPLGSVAEGNVLDNDSDVDSTGLGETEGILGFFGDGDYVSYTAGTAITSMTFTAAQNLSSVAGGEYAYLLVSGTYYLLKDGATAIKVDTNTQNADGTYNIALTAESDNYTVTNGATVAFWQQSGTPANSFTATGGKKTATVSTSTSLSSSDVTINNVTGTPTVGMTLTGTNIPAGATITEVVDNGSGSYTLTVDVQITTAPSGSIGFSGAAGTDLTGKYGTLNLAADGSYTYTPFANNASLAAGAVVTDSFEYTMVDSDGATSTAVLTIQVTGSAATDPNARDDSNPSGATEAGGAANTGGTTATGSVLTNDTTPSGSNTVVGGRAATGSTEQVITGGSYQDIDGAHGTLRLYANGTYVYTVRDTDADVQALNVGDTLDDVFSYRIRNTAGGEDVATLTITVNGANDHPQATNDTLEATEDTPVTFAAADLLGNDTDVDSASLNIQSVTSGTGGTAVLNGDGTVTFTPAANFNGTATFSYVMTDGGGTSTATVTIQVAAVNDAPSAEPNTYETNKNTSLTGINVITDTDSTDGQDHDTEGDALGISKVNGLLFDANSSDTTYGAADGWMELALSHGTLFIQQDGSTVYRPATDDVAGDNFTYVLSDGQDESAPTLVFLNVNDPSNTPAVIGGDAAGTVTEDDASPDLTDTGTLTVADVDSGEAVFLTDPSDITASTGALGSLSITSAGAWIYTVTNADVQYLTAGQTKTETFTVKTLDGTTHDVVVTINGVNDAPVPGDVSDPTWNATDGRYEVSTPEDTAKSGTIAASDLDADTLSFTTQTGPAHGTLSLNATTGAWTYTPDADYVGADSFVVTVADGHGGSVNVTVLVDVTPVNDPPVPGDVSDPTWNSTSGQYEVSTPEDTAKSGTIAASDLDADTLSFTEQTAPTHGSITLNATTGDWTYTPDANYVGADSFVVTVADGHGGSANVTVLVDVTPVNDPPVPGDVSDPTWNATDGRYEVSTPEDTAKSGTIAASDLDADTLSFTEQTGPAHGTLSLNATTGAWTYTPDADYVGADSFVVTVADGHGGSANVTVLVDVTPVNDAPVPGDVSDPTWNSADGRYEISTPEDTPKSGTIAASDLDADTLSFTEQTGPAHGTLSLNATTGAWTYTPNADYVGADSFVVTVADGHGGSANVTVLVDVTPVNDPPVPGDVSDQTWNAADGRYEISTPEDTAKSGTIAASDLDADTLSFTEQTGPAHGTLSLNATTGAWTYTPDADYVGADSFVVTVADGHGGSANVTVLVDVTPVNDPPVPGDITDPTWNAADGRYEVSTPEDTAKSGTIAASDLDADTLSFTEQTGPAHGTLSLNATTGAWTYTPDADYVGNDSFVVTVADGHGGSINVTVLVDVTPVNDPPVPGDITDPTWNSTSGQYEVSTPEDTAKSGTIAASDLDADTLSFTEQTGPAHGSLTLNATTGAWTYTPDADYVGNDSFVVTVADGHGGSVNVTVLVDVTPVNDPPVPGDITDPTWNSTSGQYEVSTPEDTAKSGTIAASDLDADTLSFTEQTAPTHGSITLNATTGAWTYTPDADYVGNDSFVVTVADGHGGSANVTVLVDVTPVNDPPVPGDVLDPTWNSSSGQYEVSTPEDTAKSGTIAASDLDADTLSFTTQTGPAHGTLTLNPATGDWTYTPDADYVGADSFVVTVADGHGGSANVTVLVDVTPVNDAPVPGDVLDPTWNSADGRYEISTPEDTPKSGTIAASDLDADTLSFTEQTGPTHGTLSLNATTGAWTYTPDADYVGADSFVVTVADGHGGSANVTVLVDVTPVNDPPVPGDITDPTWNAADGRYEVSTPEDTPKSGTIAASDLDADTLSFTEQTGPTHGTLSLNATTGAWTYTPDADYVGADSFVVTVADGHGGSANVTVLVDVTPVNDAPVPGDVLDPTWNAADSRYEVSTPEDTAKSGTIAASDLDADTLSFTEQTGPAHGTLSLNATTGAWTYTPDADYVGNDSFVVTVADGHGGSVNVTVLVDVTPVNDPPVPGDITDPTWNAADGRYEVSTPEDTAKSGTIAASDLDADTLSFTEQTAPTHGSITLDPATGDWTYTPNGDFHGNDSFVVLVSDGHGGTTAVTVVVEVTPVEDPVAVTPAPLTPAPAQAAPAPLVVEDAAPKAGLRFDSTTFTAAPLSSMPQLSAEVLALIRPALDRAPDISALTRANGFQILVSPMGSGELMLNRSITDQFVDRTAVSSFVLPFDTFTHARPDATVTLTARLADGRALPAWIGFDARSGTFRSAPPNGVEGDFVIEVTARDEKGNEVKTQFKLSVGQKAVTGRVGLSEQLKQEARRSLAWQDSVRAAHETGAAVTRAPTAPITQKAGA